MVSREKRPRGLAYVMYGSVSVYHINFSEVMESPAQDLGPTKVLESARHVATMCRFKRRDGQGLVVGRSFTIERLRATAASLLWFDDPGDGYGERPQHD